MNVEVRYSVYFMKMKERSDTTLRHSAVRYSLFCGSLFKSDPDIEAWQLAWKIACKMQGNPER